MPKKRRTSRTVKNTKDRKNVITPAFVIVVFSLAMFMTLSSDSGSMDELSGMAVMNVNEGKGDYSICSTQRPSSQQQGVKKSYKVNIDIPVFNKDAAVLDPTLCAEKRSAFSLLKSCVPAGKDRNSRLTSRLRAQNFCFRDNMIGQCMYAESLEGANKGQTFCGLVLRQK